jgi:hypothetical protein
MAEPTRLLDAYGRPVNLAALRREHAAPQVAGVRKVWTDTVASGLTPKRLAALIRRASIATVTPAHAASVSPPSLPLFSHFGGQTRVFYQFLPVLLRHRGSANSLIRKSPRSDLN